MSSSSEAWPRAEATSPAATNDGTSHDEASAWIYINAQTTVTAGALVWLYLRHNSSFYFVRNMFMIAWALAILGYIVYQNIQFVREGQESLVRKDVPASWFQSINAIAIVIFAPLFSMMWTALGSRGLEPPSLVKQALGLFLLAIGYVVIAMRVRDLDPTVKVSMFWLTALYIIHTWGELCLSPIGLSMVAKLSPVRFASLLMGVWFLSNAAANNFAGKLSELYPPGENEVRQAAKVGIDLPPLLDKQVTPTPDQLKKLEEIGVRASYPTVLGFEIRDLFQFFMIFVVSAGLASVVLLLLSRKLLRMMHGIR